MPQTSPSTDSEFQAGTVRFYIAEQSGSLSVADTGLFEDPATFASNNLYAASCFWSFRLTNAYTRAVSDPSLGGAAWLCRVLAKFGDACTIACRQVAQAGDKTIPAFDMASFRKLGAISQLPRGSPSEILTCASADATNLPASVNPEMYEAAGPLESTTFVSRSGLCILRLRVVRAPNESDKDLLYRRVRALKKVSEVTKALHAAATAVHEQKLANVIKIPFVAEVRGGPGCVYIVSPLEILTESESDVPVNVTQSIYQASGRIHKYSTRLSKAIHSSLNGSSAGSDILTGLRFWRARRLLEITKVGVQSSEALPSDNGGCGPTAGFNGSAIRSPDGDRIASLAKFLSESEEIHLEAERGIKSAFKAFRVPLKLMLEVFCSVSNSQLATKRILATMILARHARRTALFGSDLADVQHTRDKSSLDAKTRLWDAVQLDTYLSTRVVSDDEVAKLVLSLQSFTTPGASALGGIGAGVSQSHWSVRLAFPDVLKSANEQALRLSFFEHQLGGEKDTRQYLAFLIAALNKTSLLGRPSYSGRLDEDWLRFRIYKTLTGIRDGARIFVRSTSSTHMSTEMVHTVFPVMKSIACNVKALQGQATAGGSSALPMQMWMLADFLTVDLHSKQDRHLADGGQEHKVGELGSSTERESHAAHEATTGLLLDLLARLSGKVADPQEDHLPESPGDIANRVQSYMHYYPEANSGFAETEIDACLAGIKILETIQDFSTLTLSEEDGKNSSLGARSAMLCDASKAVERRVEWLLGRTHACSLSASYARVRILATLISGEFVHVGSKHPGVSPGYLEQDLIQSSLQFVSKIAYLQSVDPRRADSQLTRLKLVWSVLCREQLVRGSPFVACKTALLALRLMSSTGSAVMLMSSAGQTSTEEEMYETFVCLRYLASGLSLIALDLEKQLGNGSAPYGTLYVNTSLESSPGANCSLSSHGKTNCVSIIRSAAIDALELALRFSHGLAVKDATPLVWEIVLLNILLMDDSRVRHILDTIYSRHIDTSSRVIGVSVHHTQLDSVLTNSELVNTLRRIVLVSPGIENLTEKGLGQREASLESGSALSAGCAKYLETLLVRAYPGFRDGQSNHAEQPQLSFLDSIPSRSASMATVDVQEWMNMFSDFAVPSRDREDSKPAADVRGLIHEYLAVVSSFGSNSTHQAADENIRTLYHQHHPSSDHGVSELLESDLTRLIWQNASVDEAKEFEEALIHAIDLRIAETHTRSNLSIASLGPIGSVASLGSFGGQNQTFHRWTHGSFTLFGLDHGIESNRMAVHLAARKGDAK